MLKMTEKIENKIDSKKASLFSKLFTPVKDNTDIKSSILLQSLRTISSLPRHNILGNTQTRLT
jgi:hypothetical protein